MGHAWEGWSQSLSSFWGRVNQSQSKTLRQLLPFPLGFWDPCSCVFLLSWKQQL